MSRIIQPVELGKAENAIVQELKRLAQRQLGRKVSVSSIMRRSLQIAGPRIVNGQDPLVPEVSLKP